MDAWPHLTLALLHMANQGLDKTRQAFHQAAAQFQMQRISLHFLLLLNSINQPVQTHSTARPSTNLQHIAIDKCVLLQSSFPRYPQEHIAPVSQPNHQ